MTRRLRAGLQTVCVPLTQGREPASGLPLPPVPLRAGGGHFRADHDFVAAARAEARRLIDTAGLHEGSRVLDLGCGAGRLAIGIVAELGAIRSYCGVDVGAQVIAWCERHLAPRAPCLQFRRVDVRNERYNPMGSEMSQGYRLPVEDTSMDIVHAYSLFSHMVAADVAAYVAEVRRVLADGGRAVVTAFVEDGVPEQTVNPAGYGPRTWRGALHCVLFDRQFFDALLADGGLRTVEFRHGGETDGQSLYVAEVAP